MEPLKLYTVVHPIPAGNPWNAPEGWRWAIHTTDQLHQVDVGCLNAAWQPTQQEAELMLSCVLITVRRALTAAGVQSVIQASVLADCPLNDDIVAELTVLL